MVNQQYVTRQATAVAYLLRRSHDLENCRLDVLGEANLSRKIILFGIPLLLVVVLLIMLNILSTPRETQTLFTQNPGSKRLVVLVHGLSGFERLSAAKSLILDSLPDSDLLTFDYDARVISNASPFEIANTVERQINQYYQSNNYDQIVLVGHSLGGMILRKTIVWANGLEEDRGQFGLRGRREWVTHVSRFISLATINRGWSISPKPELMPWYKFVEIWIGERLLRLSRSGRLVLAMERGSPFVSDARVQWIELCRGEASQKANIPVTIHFLGDRDDIVSHDDSKDLKAAKDTIFVTLQNTGHEDIATALDKGDTATDRKRREQIGYALRGDFGQLEADRPDPQLEDLSVARVVYVMHGIRDYGEWTDKVRALIESEDDQDLKTVVVNQKYGHFPMLPFILYWDRQKNVRLFMDEYTENVARFPRVREFDYIGHSNGTYILASALYQYRTLKVNRVYFAGSVVPKYYDWINLLDNRRVGHVVNVVAAGDWVVALFPRFFEQIAEWEDRKPMGGLLDIGSGGFRGFDDAKDPKGRVENFEFADGSHGIGVDAGDKKKLEAIVRYISFGQEAGLKLFQERDYPEPWLDNLSNVSWLVWIILAVVFGGVTILAARINIWVGCTFVLVVLGLLYSV
jgi:pimeloyl-ACP methyl ester carboxylesterase